MELEISIKGKAAKAIQTIQRIAGKKAPVDVIISALRIYEWILAQQAQGHTIVSERAEGDKREKLALVDCVKDKEVALHFFQGRDIFER